MTRIRFADTHLAGGVFFEPQIGDELQMVCVGRIYAVEEDLIDVTPVGAPEPQTVSGETQVKMTIEIKEATPWAG